MHDAVLLPICTAHLCVARGRIYAGKHISGVLYPQSFEG